MDKTKLKRGHLRADGLVFWCYNPLCKFGERWVTLETFQRYKERNAERERKWTKDNPELARLRNAKSRAKNLKFVLERTRNWKANNRAWVNEYRRNRVAAKRQEDPVFRLTVDFRCSLGLAFRNKGFRKNSKCQKILGCSFLEVKQHLERQFVPGMTWENRGKWHIDHIVPLASAKTEEDVVRLNHYTNLRPLWAIDNLKKGARPA